MHFVQPGSEVVKYSMYYLNTWNIMDVKSPALLLKKAYNSFLSILKSKPNQIIFDIPNIQLLSTIIIFLQHHLLQRRAVMFETCVLEVFEIKPQLIWDNRNIGYHVVHVIHDAIKIVHRLLYLWLLAPCDLRKSIIVVTVTDLVDQAKIWCQKRDSKLFVAICNHFVLC